MGQWPRLLAPNAGRPDSTPGQRIRSYMPQLKIPHAATINKKSRMQQRGLKILLASTKTWRSQKKERMLGIPWQISG